METTNGAMKKRNLTDGEVEGLKEMRSMNKEYLGSGDGSKQVRDFLSRAQDDEDLLLRFFIGRKNRPKHAWETLKRYAEVRFDDYPEIFPTRFPTQVVPLLENHIMGLLKARDSKGRVIAYFMGGDWDTSVIDFQMITIAAAFLTERFLVNEDAMNNGIVFIQDCSGMGMRHAKVYTLKNMLRLMQVFWYAFPLKFKEIYYLNVPYFLTFIYGIIGPFFPKKLKQRFVMSPTGKKFEALHERISPDILPKCLGGNLENQDACDIDTLKEIIN